MNRLEALLESYRELISDDEILAKQIGHLEAKIQKIRKKQDKIYGDMAILEQEIRQLINAPEEPLDVEPKKEVPHPHPKRRIGPEPDLWVPVRRDAQSIWPKQDL